MKAKVGTLRTDGKKKNFASPPCDPERRRPRFPIAARDKLGDSGRGGSVPSKLDLEIRERLDAEYTSPSTCTVGCRARRPWAW